MLALEGQGKAIEVLHSLKQGMQTVAEEYAPQSWNAYSATAGIKLASPRFG